MNMKTILALGAALSATVASADVLKIDGQIALDGKLDESAWSKAEWHSDFQRFYSARFADGSRTPRVKTEFAVLADAENVYVGVRAHHPRMEWLKKKSAGPKMGKWGAEGFELYFCPDGSAFQYYHFLVTHQGDTFTIFRTEGGYSSPDPYAPLWEHRIANEDWGWTCEVKLPLSAFYMTRTGIWSTKWRMNLARAFVGESGEGGGEYSAWCDCESHFNELPKFRTMDGFPVRKVEEDVFIKSVVPDVRSKDGDTLKGAYRFAVYAAKGGAFTLAGDRFGETKVELKDGDNTFEVESALPPNGRTREKFVLTRTSDGVSLGRIYPVAVDYRPIAVKLTTPQYRGNFYPGQCADKVVGSVTAVGKGPIELTLEGPGFARQTARLEKNGPFAFETRGFEYGDATLTVRCGDETFVRKIRRLPPLPEGQHASWIEDGNLVIDGKPVFRRNIYATGFMGGKAFAKKFRTDDLHLTKLVQEIAEFDPGPLRNGEAQKDQMPSRKMFEKIDAGLKRGLSGDKGIYYYCVDEPEQHNLSPVYLRHVYDYVAEKDPYHVILCCSRSGRYIDVADWFEVHPYIDPRINPEGKRVYGTDFNRLGTCVDSFRPGEHPDKCIGGTPTAFAYGTGDYPTFREYVLNYWCELVRGAKTMFPYAYHDLGDRAALYEGTRYMFESIEALEDVLLFARRETLAKTEEYECALWTTKSGDRLLAVLNFTTKPLTVSVPNLAGSFREFRGTRTFDGSRPFALEPLESLVASDRPMDKGLKTYAQQQAEIDAAEEARTHRGNQLGGRHKVLNPDIRTSSGKRGGWRNDSIKLFDGILDVIAWADPKPHEKFYEIGFAKLPVTFGKLNVWGLGLEDMKLKVRTGDEWKDLTPASVTREGNCVTCTFADKVAPASLRLEFPKTADVEIYEIEL